MLSVMKQSISSQAAVTPKRAWPFWEESATKKTMSAGFHHGLLYICLLQVGAIDAGFGVAAPSEKIDVGI